MLVVDLEMMDRDGSQIMSCTCVPCIWSAQAIQLLLFHVFI